MRCLRLCLTALCALLLVTASASPQGKDKDKDKDKDKEKKEGFKFPTEIAGKDLEGWSKELRDKDDPTVRQAAIRTVPHFGPPAHKALPSLLAALKEPDAGLRVDAATAVGTVLSRLDAKKDADDLAKGITALTALAEDPQRPVRLSAINTLAFFGVYARSSIKALAAAAHDSQSWEVRRAALQALGVAGAPLADGKGPDATAFKELMTGLKDPCAPVRLAAVLGLSNLGPPGTAADLKTEKDGLDGRLKDRDKVVALYARTLLLFLDEKPKPTDKEKALWDKSLDALAKYLDDTDLHVRVEAVNALGRLGRKASAKVPDLISAANDKEVALALAATGALGRMDDADAVPALQKLLKGKDTDIDVRCQAARSLGALNVLAKSAIPDLTETTKDKDAALAIAAMEGLVAMGPDLAKSAIPTIKELTDSKDEAIKEAATNAHKLLTADKPKK